MAGKGRSVGRSARNQPGSIERAKKRWLARVKNDRMADIKPPRPEDDADDDLEEAA